MAPSRRSAVVLCGGFGTRLREAVPDLPKPLAPVRGKPFLWYLIDQLRENGIVDVVLALHYQPERFTAFASEYRSAFPDVVIRESVEPSPLGTGGGVRFALETCPMSDPFYVLNGDSIVRNGMRAMQQAPDRTTIGLVHVADAGRYGRVETHGEKVTAFLEKGDPVAGWINCGIYLLEQGPLWAMPAGAFSIERELFPELLKEGAVFSEKIEEPFIDIGIPDDYRRFEAELATFVLPNDAAHRESKGERK